MCKNGNAGRRPMRGSIRRTGRVGWASAWPWFQRAHDQGYSIDRHETPLPGEQTMKPTEILSGEHRVIEQVLDCLERIAQRCRDEAVWTEASAMQALDFFRNFADRCHHGKEETHLFPAMEAKGFPRDAGPTASCSRARPGPGLCPLDGRGRGAAAEGDADAIAGFVAAAHGAMSPCSASISRRKITACSRWPTGLHRRGPATLLNAFEEVEAEHWARARTKSICKWPRNLARRYGVAAVPASVAKLRRLRASRTAGAGDGIVLLRGSRLIAESPKQTVPIRFSASQFPWRRCRPGSRRPLQRRRR